MLTDFPLPLQRAIYRFLACLLYTQLLMQAAVAQPDLAQRTGTTIADTGVAGYRFTMLRLSSSDGARSYRLHVALPTQLAPDGGYSVAWLLDGNAALMDVGAATLASLAKQHDAPMIVFIAHDNDLRTDGDARAYDYTPRRPGGETSQRDPLGNRRNGGADAFLDLILEQAMPRVAALAPVNLARQSLWGHSYGGLLVLHALFTRPQSFNEYGVADPSLWWGDGYLLQEEAKATVWSGNPPRLRLWLGEGGDGQKHTGSGDIAAIETMRQARLRVPPDAAPAMAERLRKHGLTVEVLALPGLSHGQTLGASLPPFLFGLLNNTAP